jgi:hypothetical protein
LQKPHFRHFGSPLLLLSREETKKTRKTGQNSCDLHCRLNFNDCFASSIIGGNNNRSTR